MRTLKQTCLAVSIAAVALVAMPSGVNATYYSEVEAKAAAAEMYQTRAAIRAAKADALSRVDARLTKTSKRTAIGLLMLAAQKDCRAACTIEINT